MGGSVSWITEREEMKKRKKRKKGKYIGKGHSAKMEETNPLCHSFGIDLVMRESTAAQSSKRKTGDMDREDFPRMAIHICM